LPASSRLTSGRLLAKNTVWSLLGQAAPVLIAILVIPRLIHGLGIDRFGVLSLAWIIVGYFGLFDFGLSAAITRLLSEKLPARSHAEIPALVWTSFFLLLALGIAGSLVAWGLSPWLVGSVLKIPDALRSETLVSFYVLAASLPIVTGTAGLAGVLAAQQRFDLLSAVRLPMGALSVLGPLAVLPFSHSLISVVGVVVAVRLSSWLAHLLMCLHTMPVLKRRIRFSPDLVRPLLTFGGWMTVSGVVGPFMIYLDRFLIGAMVSLASVAYYTTPYDLATRLWLLSSPAIGVLFPAFAASFSNDRARTSRLFTRGLQYVFVVLFPCTLILATLAPEGLTLWVGAEFAGHSARVLQLLAIGVFVNGLAQLAMVLVQGVGRPDLSARLHMIELPAYVAGVLWLIRTHGIEGAAFAWVARVTLDALVLFLMADRLLKSGTRVRQREFFAIVAGIVMLVLPIFMPVLTVRICYLAAALALYGVAVWLEIGAPARRAQSAPELNAVKSAP
jgi:O-antigen/teichoic acid export membrane protein